MKLFYLFLPLVLACKYEFQCEHCTTCYNNTCVDYDRGELCIPDNAIDIKNDIQLYHEFYYMRNIVVEEYRCNSYGVSVKFLVGLPMVSNLTKDDFNEQYQGSIMRECENWAFAGINKIIYNNI